MAMVSMAVSEAPEPNGYNQGPCVYLTEDQVEALGLKANPPAAGSPIGIRAIARVMSKTEDADIDGDGDGIDVRLTLQITDMEVTPGATGSNAGSASMLYGG